MTDAQLSSLTPEELSEYNGLDEEGKSQFEYFYGFTEHTEKAAIVQNTEVLEYQKASAAIQLKSVAKLIDFVPHRGQKPVFYAFDEQQSIYNNFVLLLGRRTGKSYVTSVTILRELLLPHSSTILLAPTFNNAQIIYRNVLKLVDLLKVPIKSVNRGSFKLELKNGAKFSANSEMNVESSLGSSQSLIVVDEAQSINDLKRIIEQLLVPTLLDYGTRDSGILWARMMFLGTPRGEDNPLTDYFYKELTLDNWKSFTAPSTTNPTLPAEYFEKLKLEMSDIAYRQEILAEIIGGDEQVFHAFDRALNLYEDGDYIFNEHSWYINGIDIGFSDSTANVMIYRTPDGSYYVQKAYIQNRTTTETHVNNYKVLEMDMRGQNDARYCDPAAAQTINDYIVTYEYDVIPAKNDVMASLQYINQLLAPSGINRKPRLYIHKDLKELIRQISRVRYKPALGKKSSDPFMKDPEGTHWDLIAALRYALFSDQYNVASMNMLTV